MPKRIDAISSARPPIPLDRHIWGRAFEIFALNLFQTRCEELNLMAFTAYMTDDELDREILAWSLACRLHRSPELARRLAALHNVILF